MGFLSGLTKAELLDIISQVTVTAGVVTAFWRFIDKVFEYLSKKSKQQIEEIVTDRIAIEIKPLKESMDKLNDNMIKVLLDKK